MDICVLRLLISTGDCCRNPDSLSKEYSHRAKERGIIHRQIAPMKFFDSKV